MEPAQSSAESVYNLAIAYEKDNGPEWNLAADNPNYKVCLKQSPDGNGTLVKAMITLSDITADELAIIILEDENRKKWDDVFSEPTVLEKIDDQTDVYYFKMKSPSFMVSDREFVSKRVSLKDYKDASYFVFMSHTEHPSKPVQSKPVRGKLHQHIRLLRKTADGKGSTLTLIMQMDFGGNVPQMLVNNKAASSPQKMFDAISLNYYDWKKAGMFDKLKK